MVIQPFHNTWSGIQVSVIIETEVHNLLMYSELIFCFALKLAILMVSAVFDSPSSGQVLNCTLWYLLTPYLGSCH